MIGIVLIGGMAYNAHAMTGTCYNDLQRLRRMNAAIGRARRNGRNVTGAIVRLSILRAIFRDECTRRRRRNR